MNDYMVADDQRSTRLARDEQINRLRCSKAERSNFGIGDR